MLSGYRTQCDRCPGLIGQFDATAFCPPLSSISTALIRPMCCHDDVVTCTWQRQRPQEGWLHASRKVQVDSLHQPCIPQGSQSRHETCRTGDVGTLFAAPVGAPSRIVKARWWFPCFHCSVTPPMIPFPWHFLVPSVAVAGHWYLAMGPQKPFSDVVEFVRNWMYYSHTHKDFFGLWGNIYIYTYIYIYIYIYI